MKKVIFVAVVIMTVCYSCDNTRAQRCTQMKAAADSSVVALKEFNAANAELKLCTDSLKNIALEQAAIATEQSECVTNLQKFLAEVENGSRDKKKMNALFAKDDAVNAKGDALDQRANEYLERGRIAKEKTYFYQAKCEKFIAQADSLRALIN